MNRQLSLPAKERSAREIADERLVHRRVLEMELVDLVGQRQLGDRYLVLDEVRPGP